MIKNMIFKMMACLILFFLLDLNSSAGPPGQAQNAGENSKSRTRDTARVELDSTKIKNDLKRQPRLAPVATGVDTGVLMSADSLDSLKKMLSRYTQSDSETANKPWNRTVANRAFQVGEKLTFVIRYGPVHAGTAIMKVPETIQYQDRKCYRIITTANSNKFFSKFYRVEDYVESVTDVEGLFSWYFEKRLREGRYKADRFIYYDQRQQLAMTKSDTVRVPHYIQDILSALYYTRTQELKIGEALVMDSYTDGRLYPLWVKVHRKERVSTQAGNFNCIVVEPLLRTEGIFHQKGRLWIYLTDDDKKMPVMMKSKILIGYITAELTKAEGIKKN